MNGDERFTQIVTMLMSSPKVTVGASKKGFGSSALCVGGKIFAMISSKGNFVVKLPRPRIDELVSLGSGARFEPTRGRVMKEWIEISHQTEVDWLLLAREAMRYVEATSGGNAK